jgi:hypothetical protein
MWEEQYRRKYQFISVVFIYFCMLIHKFICDTFLMLYRKFSFSLSPRFVVL